MKRLLLFCLFVSFCSLWAIQPKDSSPTDSTRISEPTFNARLTIGKGIFENDSRYTGAVTTADSVTHAFAGSDITYNISVDAKGYKLKKGAINLGDTIVPAKIVKRKEFELDILSEEQAIDQLELIGNNFYIYRDNQTGLVNVLYKRDDGNYGLINTK